MESKNLGISVRFIREWTADRDRPMSFDALMPTHDIALYLASQDTSARPFAEKFSDALEFIRTRPHPIVVN